MPIDRRRPVAEHAWEKGDVAHLWAPQAGDRFHCERGIIGAPTLDRGWITFQSDGRSSYAIDPRSVHDHLFASPEALRVWLLTQDLAAARKRNEEAHEAWVRSGGEITMSILRLTSAQRALDALEETTCAPAYPHQRDP
jgi:hypothetical protein